MAYTVIHVVHDVVAVAAGLLHRVTDLACHAPYARIHSPTSHLPSLGADLDGAPANAPTTNAHRASLWLGSPGCRLLPLFQLLGGTASCRVHLHTPTRLLAVIMRCGADTPTMRCTTGSPLHQSRRATQTAHA